MGEIVFLAHRNDNTDTDSLEVLACKNCQNKAWTVVYEHRKSSFPRMKCSCCGNDGGNFGWVTDDA